jgi:hypothetical protein
MNLLRSRNLAVLPQVDLSIFPPKGGKERRLSGFLRLAAMLAAMGIGSTGAWAAVCTVSSTADTNTSGTLRYCLNNYSSGDTINLTATGTITLASALAPMVNNVTITGPGPNQLTINGASAPAGSSIFSIGSTVSSPTVTISGLTFAGGNGTQGGAIASIANLTVTNCAFSANTAVSGGAISNSGPLKVTGSTFTGNSSTNGGGAIAAGSGTLTVNNSTFSGNSSNYGGAIYSISGLAVTNSTFSGNSGTGAGAIYTTGGTGTVLNSIFTGNSATATGQGAAMLSVPAVPLNASYNLYYKNLDAGTTEDDCVGCTTNTNAITGSNPNLMPLGYYGGTTQTFLSQPGSPAICNGLASAASSAGLTIDQRGFAMNPSYTPCPAGSVDIGAVQANYQQVTSATDSGVGSLRAAVSSANTNGSGDIDFAPAVTSITLSSGTLNLTGAAGINILGQPTQAVTVNGGGAASNFSVFTVGAGVPVLLDWLTISKGNTTSAAGGGGILSAGTLTVLNSTIAGNTSSAGGAGIANSGTLQIAESTIAGNTATSAAQSVYGGGIYNGGGLITAVNTTIAGNSASGTPTDTAGGIYVNTGTLNLTNSIVSGNTTVHGASANIGVNGATVNVSSGDVIGGSTNATNTLVGGTGAAITLSPLQINGSTGTTLQTMLPLPGSAAICAGLSSNIASGATTDERGFPLQPAGGYCPSANVDAGAAQTNYTGVSFQQQPTTAFLGTPMIPPPTVQLLETNTLLTVNNTDAPNGIPITLTYSGAGTLSGNSATTAGGVATYSNLKVSTTPGMNQQLLSSISVLPAGASTSRNYQAASNDFNVIGPATLLQVTAPLTTTAGVPFSVTVTAYDAAGNVATGYTGTVHFTSSDTSTYETLPANYTFVSGDTGVHTFNNLALVTVGPTQTVIATDTVTNSITGTATLAVTKANTTVTMTPAGAATNVDGLVTFTATVAPPANATLPAPFLGTMKFASSGTTTTAFAACSTQSVNATTGVATCSTQALPAGSFVVTATYSGDTNSYNASPTSSSTTQTVNALTPTLGLTPSPSGSVSVGTSVTFTAQLSGTLSPVIPKGTVSFTVNGGAINDCPTVTVSSTGSASCTTASLVVPADIVVATYSSSPGNSTSDPNYIVTSPAPYTETLSQAVAVTTLSSLPTTPVVNQPTTFSATVKPPAAAGTEVEPTGTVTFKQGGTTLCNAAVINAGNQTATCSYTFASQTSAATITATYSSDQNFTAGTGGSITSYNVSQASTTTAVTSTPNASGVNGQVTFTATVTPAAPAGTTPTTPTGTVTFTDTTNPGALTGCSGLSVSTVLGVTKATCTNTFAAPTAGDTIKAVYNGDTNFTGSTNTVPQVVNKGATSVSVTSLGASSVNQQVTFSAGFTFPAGTTVPTGTVTYLDGAATLCTFTATTGSPFTATIPSCKVPLLTAGTHSITVTYSGDTNFATATSSAFSQVVNQTSTTTTVTSLPTTSAVNQPVTFTATVTPAIYGSPSGTTNPTGTVNFSYTIGGVTTTLCSAAAVSTSASITTAQCQMPLPNTGSYTITATYSSDSNFTSGTAGSAAQQVTLSAQSDTVAVTSTAAFTNVNATVTFNSTITPGFVGATKPTGNVTYIDSSTNTTLCTASVTAGVVGACTISPSTGTPSTAAAADLTAGTHSIKASYSGDSNFPAVSAANSSGVSQVITQTGTTVAVVSSSPLVAGLPTSVATQAVTFTATITPTAVGAIVPASTSTVNFAISNGAVACAAAPVMPQANGSGIATCVYTFPATSPFTGSGQVNALVTFSGDSNFTTSNNTSSPLVQVVQNFGLAFTKPATYSSTPIFLTQGYSTSTDPFNALASPTGPITMTVTSSGTYIDALTVTCTVTSVSTGKAVADPSCSASTTTPSGATGTPVTYTIAASSAAAVGSYTVSLSATDNTVPALSHTTTTPLTVFVVGQAVALTQVPGVAGTESVTFNTATPPSGKAPTTLTTFSCPNFYVSSLSAASATLTVGHEYSTSGYLTCSFGSPSVSVSSSQTGVTVSITALSTVAQVQVGGTFRLAALWGLPLLVLMGWFGSRKSPRRSWVRFLGAILLLVAASFAVTGCGGSFTAPPTPAGGVLPQGTYLVQVVGLDQNNVTYTAVVPLTVLP